MAPPSYARATTSSALKATSIPNQHPEPSNEPSTLKSRTKKTPKRPSTITSKHRQSIAYKSDLYPITPKDPKKPCHFANLPSELRTTIYEHILSSFTSHQQPHCIIKKGEPYYIYPSLLHISRAIRIEAAYTYYTSTPFSFLVRNLNFSRIMTWLHSLPHPHRALLTRNRKLHVTIVSGLRYTHTYPPEGWFLDAPIVQHWRECAPFGNLYRYSSWEHRLRFIMFCRLISWFRASGSVQMQWRYGFDRGRSPLAQVNDAKRLMEFLKEMVGVLGMGRAWTRGRVKGKEEAKRFLEDLDIAFGEVGDGGGEDVVDEWGSVMGKLRSVVKKW